jgi:2-hydroxycyclohexanecarboxyl-CoA dehydrogenase
VDEQISRAAVVTGGASGLGLAICHHLARVGHRVGVLDANAEAAEKAAAELRATGADVVAVEVDVADPAGVTNAFGAVRDAFGPIGILVTSAAVAGFTPFDQITLDDWNRHVAVNLTGTFLCVQAVISDMLAAKWGRIVTISSAAGQSGALLQGHYSATKGGVIAMTKTLALEYSRKGITVNTIPPFTVDTPMLRAAQEAKKVPGPEFMARMIPAGRIGTVDDIGATCAFLCSEAAGYITGQVIAVNGGAVM